MNACDKTFFLSEHHRFANLGFRTATAWDVCFKYFQNTIGRIEESTHFFHLLWGVRKLITMQCYLFKL